MVVVALDDVLADGRWRLPLRGDWEAYYAEAHLDQPILPLVNMVRALGLCGVPLLITSVREERYRLAVMGWLLRFGLYVEAVRLRPEHNYMTAPELALLQVAELRDRIDLAINSSDEVLTVYRALGIETLQAGYGASERP